MLCPLRWLKPTVISFADLKIEPTAWLDIGSGEIETSPWCGLPSFVSISTVFLLAADLTQFPAALAAGGGACNLGWCLSSTVHDLFLLAKFQTSIEKNWQSAASFCRLGRWQCSQLGFSSSMPASITAGDHLEAMKIGLGTLLIGNESKNLLNALQNDSLPHCNRIRRCPRGY